MSWFARLIKDLDEDLGQAPRRLLEAIIAVAGQPSPDADTLTADKSKVLALLAEQEGASLAPEALRRRIKQINDAAGHLAQLSPAKVAPLKVRSRKTHLEIGFSALSRTARQQATARAGAVLSTKEDAASVGDDLEEPRVRKAVHRVFVSHAWEDPEVEGIVDQFIEKLKGALRSLPPKWNDHFSVEPWFDRHNMHGTTETFEQQTDPACEGASLAIFLLSNKWYASPACQREATFFAEADRAGNTRYLRVQLSGDRAQGRLDITRGPVFPGHWKPRFSNLLTLWGPEGTPAERDAFIQRLCEEVCQALNRQTLAPPPKPSPRDRIRRAATTKGHFEFEGVVEEGTAEAPRTTSAEGEGDAEPLLPMLRAWACEDEASNRIYAVLGSFGAGKTTAMQMFARTLIDEHAGNPKVPFPIYLDFRRLTETVERDQARPLSLNQLIMQSLNPSFVEGIEAEQLLAVLRSERCVIILDGLDEIGTRVGPERAANLYRQLLAIVPADAWKHDAKSGRADWAVCPTRILTTCRTHFFRDHVEEQTVLAAHDRFGSGLRRNAERIKTVYMAPFEPEQIRSFFQKSLGEEEGDRAFRAIGRAHDLQGLARKPIMTRYIAELAPDLEADLNEGRAVNAARVYQHLFRRAIERDNDKRPLMSAADRQNMLEALALHFWQQRTPRLSVNALNEWFDDYAPRRPGLAAILGSANLDARALLHTELRNASLLVREHDNGFRFVHTSFQEYFLACALLSALLDDRFRDLATVPETSRETLEFTLDLVDTRDDWNRFTIALDRTILSDHTVEQRALSFALRRAAADRDRPTRLTLPPAADLSDLDLRSITVAGTPMVPLQLWDVSFERARLFGSQFRNVVFDRCRFGDAAFGRAFLECSQLTDCQGKPAYASAVRCYQVEADASSEKGVLESVVFRNHARETLPGVDKLVRGCRTSLGHGGAVLSAEFSADGTTILTASDDSTARLWDARTGAEITRLEGHGGPVSSAVFSADGATILTASSDKTARLWDARTGAENIRLEGHGGGLFSAVFSPDGATILTASSDKTASIWDTRTGAEITRLEGHDGAVVSAVFSADGASIITASSDKTACLWDARIGACLKCLEGHGGAVSSAVFSADGATILTASDDGTARLWNARTGAEITRLEGHDGALFSAVFSVDGTTILTASTDDVARLWDACSGAEITRLKGHGSSVVSAVFSPDDATILTASDDGTARLWNARTGAEITRLEGHRDVVFRAVLSTDGATILTASEDDTARLWDARTGAEITRLEGHGSRLFSAVFSVDGATVLTASSDKTARLWDARTGTEIARLESHRGAVFSAVFSSDGLTVLTATGDVVHLWDARTGAEITRLEGHRSQIFSAVFSANGATVLTASSDKTARLWNARTGAEIVRLEGHADWVMSATFSADGTTVLTASSDNTAHLWDARTGAEITRLEGHTDWVRSAVFSADGTTILTASDDNTVRLWDTQTGAEITRLDGHTQWVMSAVFSPDETTILTASHDNTARLWDTRTGAEIARLEGHAGSVVSAVFSADGTTIVTASDDKTARLWDARTGECQKCLEGHGSRLLSAAFSADGATIVTASYDKTARLWDARTGECQKCLLGLPTSWAVLDDDLNVVRIGPEAWKYVHGLARNDDGFLRVVEADLTGVEVAD